MTELAVILADLASFHPPPRFPRTRADCIDGPRPCPHRTCEFWTPGPACTLDVADRGGATLDEVAEALGGYSRERIRQIEGQAVRKMRRYLPLFGLERGELHGVHRPQHREPREGETGIAARRREAAGYRAALALIIADPRRGTASIAAELGIAGLLVERARRSMHARHATRRGGAPVGHGSTSPAADPVRLVALLDRADPRRSSAEVARMLGLAVEVVEGMRRAG